jgi:hypothetical protein
MEPRNPKGLRGSHEARNELKEAREKINPAQRSKDTRKEKSPSGEQAD